MGDQVLLENQVNPVMDVALDNGLEVTALHNHFFWDSPKVMFMHIGGMGDEQKLATAIGKVFAKIKETSGGNGGAGTGDDRSGEEHAGPGENRIRSRTEGRSRRPASTRSQSGARRRWVATRWETPWASTPGLPSPGATTRRWSTATSRCTSEKFKAYSKRLRHAGIRIVAIHNHMIGESPRVIFCISGERVRRKPSLKA